MADFGPANAFDGNPVRDGIVWRITPEGDTARVVDGGIGDPNFLLLKLDLQLILLFCYNDPEYPYPFRS